MTHDKPKALVEVAGSSIVGRAIHSLVEYGVQKVILATGYREDALRRALAGAPVPIDYRLNPMYETTQNSVSLGLCRDAVGDDSFFKLDGDVVFDGAILQRLDAAPAPLSVAVDGRGRLDEEAMKVRVGERNRILAFGKEIPVADAHGESIGIERVRSDAVRDLFDALGRARERGRHDLYYEDVYDELVRAGLPAAAVDVSDLAWAEIDDVADLRAAERLLCGQ
jgi:choline kinase